MVNHISIKLQPEGASETSNFVNVPLTLWFQIPQTRWHKI